MPAWVIPAAMAVGSLIGNLITQRAQNKANRKLADEQAAANQAAIDKQNAYNSPESQIARFQSANLNPALAYGQGNPGQQTDYAKTDYGGSRVDLSNLVSNMVPAYNQTAMAQSQVQATDAQTRRIGVLTKLNELQAQVLEKNPSLNAEGYKAIISSLVSTAEIKASESGIRRMDQFFAEATRGMQAEKVFREVQLLEQRFKLGELDSKIKAEVLNSKEFSNAILEVQKKFMLDGTITPQHIFQFIQLLLMKSL